MPPYHPNETQSVLPPKIFPYSITVSDSQAQPVSMDHHKAYKRSCINGAWDRGFACLSFVDVI
jgi:hypothetical protein